MDCPVLLCARLERVGGAGPRSAVACGRGASAPAPCRLVICASSEAAACTLSLVGGFVCTVAVEKAPINLSQVMWASSLLEEASAPMYLTNDRLRDRGEIIGSFHLLSAEHGAVSLVASRGQQPLVVPSAGRERFHFAFGAS